MPLKTIGPKIESQPLNDNLADLENRKVEQPFPLKSVVYDSINNKIDATLGPGISDFLQTIITKTIDSVYAIPTPAINTSYYIYIKSDGTFTHNTTGAEVDGAVKLWIVATGSTVDAITTTDQRGQVNGSAQAVKDLLDTHEAAADPHPQYLPLNGSKAMTGDLHVPSQMIGNYTWEKNLLLTFTDNTVQQEIEIEFTGGYSGAIEIILASHYNYGNAIGSIKKMIFFGVNSAATTVYENTGVYKNLAPRTAEAFMITNPYVRNGKWYIKIINKDTWKDNAYCTLRFFVTSEGHITTAKSINVLPIATSTDTWAKPFDLSAIVEQGSNANGEYIRYDNGVQECWFITDITGLSVANGAIYVSPNLTFPANFLQYGKVGISYAGYVTEVNGSRFSIPIVDDKPSLDGQYWKFSFKNTSGTTLTRVAGLKLYAIGKWK
jgi:hypothetical protein